MPGEFEGLDRRRPETRDTCRSKLTLNGHGFPHRHSIREPQARPKGHAVAEAPGSPRGVIAARVKAPFSSLLSTALQQKWLA